MDYTKLFEDIYKQCNEIKSSSDVEKALYRTPYFMYTTYPDIPNEDKELIDALELEMGNDEIILILKYTEGFLKKVSHDDSYQEFSDCDMVKFILMIPPEDSVRDYCRLIAYGQSMPYFERPVRNRDDLLQYLCDGEYKTEIKIRDRKAFLDVYRSGL